jgi:nitrite reductase/ring-hydroxylating ferredoxin subunit/uncharacterized membrane protein
MKSHAAVASHPLHAMLIPFPFAFLVGTVVFDAIGLFGGLPTFWLVGHYMLAAGILTALAAAIPGIIDYATTVPPRSSAKKRAATHGLTNITAVVLFAAAWFSRSSSEPTVTPLLLEAVAAAALSSGAWMGGTLVYRNQIGVDHRYARAGKWREATISVPKGDFVTVADAEELKPGQMKLLHLNARRWVVARTAGVDGATGVAGAEHAAAAAGAAGMTAAAGGELTASEFAVFDDRCPHRGGSLADGCLVDGTVQCPWHGSQFEVKTGRVVAGPAKDGIATCEVRIDGGNVKLRA